MVWLAPWALAGLALLAGPVIVHLLTRRAARRVRFPATHFVRAAPAASVAPRRPSDLRLLLLRLAIVAAAVLAVARPLLMTRWRLADWNRRVSRAVVIDGSPSMTRDAAGGASGAAIAAGLADAELRGVFAARTLTATDLADGTDRAVRWLRGQPPSRREIVVISDFQQSALDAKTIAAIPADVGIRFRRAGAPPQTRRTELPPIEGWRGRVWQATAIVDANGTRTSWVPRGEAATPRWISVKAAAADADAADRALRAAVAQGVRAGDDEHRVLVRFAGAEALRPAPGPIQTPWIARAALALASRRDTGLAPPAWIDGGSAAASGGGPALGVSERDGMMVVDAPFSAAAFEAPAIVRAALLAVRPAALADGEAETVALTDTELAAWRRDPAPVTSQAVAALMTEDGTPDAMAAESDARWFWGLAVLLLAVEWRLRRAAPPSSAAEVHASAA